MKTVYLLITMDLNNPKMTFITGVFDTLQKAMKHAVDLAVTVNGSNITTHGVPVQSVELPHSTEELTNGFAISSPYGISYTSFSGQDRMVRMVLPTEVR